MSLPAQLLKGVEILSPVDEVSFPSEWYDLNAPDHFWFHWRFAVVQRLLAGLKLDLKAPARALDIGCGVGTLRDQLEGFTAWTIDGVDLNLQALGRAGPGRGRLFFYDILKPRPEFVATYDYVFLFDVLEHISPTRAFVESVLRPLRPGGCSLSMFPPWSRCAASMIRPPAISAATPPARSRRSFKSSRHGSRMSDIGVSRWFRCCWSARRCCRAGRITARSSVPVFSRPAGGSTAVFRSWRNWKRLCSAAHRWEPRC